MRQLPQYPDLDQLRHQARDLQRQHPGMRLTAAQAQLAREYGFSGWERSQGGNGASLDAVWLRSPSSLEEVSDLFEWIGALYDPPVSRSLKHAGFNLTVRVATYTRISTDEEHQPYSREAQDERLHSYVRSQDGWELTRQFTDQMSGSSLERPGLQRALAEARVHRYDLLLVYRADRLAGSVRGLAEILHALDKAGAVFRSVTEPFDTGSPAGRMMVQVLSVFIDRVIVGMEFKAARGGWNGGPVPFGYRTIPRRPANSDARALITASDFLEVDRERAPIVQVIFDLYANKRLGSRAIASWLTWRGHRPGGGRPWSFRSVLTIVRNRVSSEKCSSGASGTQHPTSDWWTRPSSTLLKGC